MVQQTNDVDCILVMGSGMNHSGVCRGGPSIGCHVRRYNGNILIQNVLCLESNLALLGSTGPYWALLGSIWANIFTDALTTLRMDKCLCKMGAGGGAGGSAAAHCDCTCLNINPFLVTFCAICSFTTLSSWTQHQWTILRLSGPVHNI